MLINRYLFREICHTFFAVILVILLIAISNKFARLVGQAAAGAIAPSILAQVILLQIPELLAFLLPIALYLAILLCFSRFFVDNEIPVMFACGISWQRLIGVCLGLSLIIMTITGALTCYWNPKLGQYREQLLHEEGLAVLVQTIMPGRFHSLQEDKFIFYVANLSADRHELSQVFIAEQPTASFLDDKSVIAAKTGKVVTDPTTGSTYFKLFDGRRYHGTPGEMDYNILEFKQYQRLLEGNSAPSGLFYHRTMPMSMLWEHPTPGNLAELQWRLSIPLSALLLALLAVPLSRVSPRGGRYGRLFLAIVICIFYFNLLTLSKRWVAAQALPAVIGVWWVHALLLLTALLLIAKISGRGRQGYEKLRAWVSAK